MTIKIQTLTCLSLFLATFGLAWSNGNEAQPSTQFAVSTIRFEQNVTDKDVEAVIEVKGGTEGLVKLTVISPEGRKIVDVTAPDPTTLGLRHFSFESPEPKEISSLKKAYPEGDYQFIGTTSSGTKLNGKSTLTYALTEPATFINPKADAEDVNVKNLRLVWSPVKNAASYIVSLEQPGSDLNFTAKLPGSVTSLAIPEGFLAPGKEYTLGIGTVTDKGNITYAETSFKTM